MPYDLTQEQRAKYRATSIRSQQRKLELLHPDRAYAATALSLGSRLDPNDLMPQVEPSGLSCLSLFSGGGGLDLGFERAGFEHRALFELLDVCGETLRGNRPRWDVRSGAAQGDVCAAAFSAFRGVDVVHGGPPCQPFSVAGKQAGADDPRNMWSDYVRCVEEVRPRAFVAENVVGILDRKFEALFCDPTEEGGVIFAERTYYELGYDKFYLEREPLESSDDVQRALATLDALFAGKAVTLSSADGLASRTWVFVNSRGLRTTVTESRISCALGQRTAWRGRKWHRHRMRPLAEFVVA